MYKYGVRFIILPWSETRLYEKSDQRGRKTWLSPLPRCPGSKKRKSKTLQRPIFWTNDDHLGRSNSFLFQWKFTKLRWNYRWALLFEIKPNTILVRPGILGTWYYTLRVYLVDCVNLDATNKRAFWLLPSGATKQNWVRITGVQSRY